MMTYSPGQKLLLFVMAFPAIGRDDTTSAMPLFHDVTRAKHFFMMLDVF